MKKMKFESYRDRNGKYRWRLRARNGRIIATSSEAYENAGDRDKAITLVRRSVIAPVVKL